MIMIDETQDFDIMMLRMILDDTTIPKLFVGDPMQSIYKWRGCINGFDYMPSNSLTIEFYSTFRIGDPACELIRSKFKDCWMISKSKNSTILSKDNSLLSDTPYTYLFRTWRHLLQTAKITNGIWIGNYAEQVDKMRSLHTILLKYGGAISYEEFPDDLPMFLKSLSSEELDTLICTIENNLTKKENARYKFYTIHSYKGLEDDNIRIANDIEDIIGDTDPNLYYVALTRGMKLIVEDKSSVETILPITKIETSVTATNNTTLTIKDMFKKLVDKEPSKYPAKMGKKWTDEEVQSLLNSIRNKKSIELIANEHERTVGGVNSQRNKLAVEYWKNDKRSIEEIERFTGLTKGQIQEAIDRDRIKTSITESQSSASDSSDMIILLKDIQSKLTLLLEKFE